MKRSKALRWLDSARASVTHCGVVIRELFTPEYRVLVPVPARSPRRVGRSR